MPDIQGQTECLIFVNTRLNARIAILLYNARKCKRDFKIRVLLSCCHVTNSNLKSHFPKQPFKAAADINDSVFETLHPRLHREKNVHLSYIGYQEQKQSTRSLPVPELYQLQFIIGSSLNSELSLIVTEFYPFLQVPHRFLPLKNHSFRRQQRPGVELPSPSVCYEPDLIGTKPQSFTCLYLSLRPNTERIIQTC